MQVATRSKPGSIFTVLWCVAAADDSRDALAQLNGMLKGAAGAEEAMIR
jgi:hypothetical protein